MDRCREVLQADDYLVLLSSLRTRICFSWNRDPENATAQVLDLLGFIELGIRTNRTSESAFAVARSMLALGRPEAALKRVETLLRKAC